MLPAPPRPSGVIALAIPLIIAVTACGGGSGGSSAPAPAPASPAAPAPPAPPPSPAAAPIAVKPTSYENFKAVGLTPQTLPAEAQGTGVIRAFADFSQQGQLDLFTATLTYWPPTTPAAASPATFAFWKKQPDGSYAKDTTKLSSSAGCIHPRKALVADFNGDGRPDVFVACHGFDAPPFPGEKNKVVLSKADGSYEIKDAAPDIGFFHGASAADLNGDGLIDVVVADTNDSAKVYASLNKGGGVFERETAPRFPAALSANRYYSTELLDVDEDGRPDLWLGGHEWEMASSTVVLLNPGDHKYTAVASTVLPPVANDGVVLDVTATGSGPSRTLWINRTSGGDGTFYQSRVIQKVSWPTKASSMALNTRPGQWVAWTIPATVDGQNVIASEDANANLKIPQ